MHIHAYGIKELNNTYKISLTQRVSTDSNGISDLLGLKANQNLGLEELIKILQSKISEQTILKIQ